MPQFNGKQEGEPNTADLTCAAPATVSGRIPRNSVSITQSHWARLNSAPGKAMEVDPPARIPANEVATPFPKGKVVAVTPKVLAGKPVRAMKPVFQQ